MKFFSIILFLSFFKLYFEKINIEDNEETNEFSSSQLYFLKFKN